MAKKTATEPISENFMWRNIPVERAVDIMLEEHGDDALKQVRLGKAAGRRQRSRKIYGYWEAVERLLLDRASAGAGSSVEEPPTKTGGSREG